MTDAAQSFYAAHGKRLADLVVATIGLLVTAPLHLVCAVVVLMDDGPPIYFVQNRAGRGGRTFRLVKLRTMQVGTEAVSKNYPTIDMVTRSGRWLRRLSLDELPQLFNILRGDMSFVGPRPALPSQVERYTCEQRRRLEVRPGLTGLAQVVYRNDAPWSRRIEADLQYIATMSVLTDLKIMARTIPVALRGDGNLVGQTASEVDDLGRPEGTGRE